MRAPVEGGVRLVGFTVAPERSSKVLAINSPRPRPESSSDLGAPILLRRHIRLAETSHHIRRKAGSVVFDRHFDGGLASSAP